MNDKQTILLVDDSKDDVLLMRVAFKKAEFNSLLREACNGEEAIAYLKGAEPYSDRDMFPLPDLILLDLNMPKKNGFHVLEWMRGQPKLQRIAVIILTASMRREDIEQAYELGASSFLVKPGSMTDLVAMLRCLKDWLQLNHFPPLNRAVKR